MTRKTKITLCLIPFLLALLFFGARAFGYLDPINNDKLMTMLKEKRYDKAVFCLREYIKKNPDDIDAKIALGDCYYLMGYYQEALDVFGKILEENPDSEKAAAYVTKIQSKLQ